ncbi:hypothetical protein ACLMJK_003556 [Lecanora helva]
MDIPHMEPAREIIDLTNEEYLDEFNFEDFLAENGNGQDDPGAANLTQANGTQLDDVPGPHDPYQACLNKVLEVFPDVSHDHTRRLYDENVGSFNLHTRRAEELGPVLIEKILDGGVYPKERDRLRELKRKRSDREVDEEEAAKWRHMDLREAAPIHYAKVAKLALQEAFEFVPVHFIEMMFREHGYYYGAYFAILKAEQDYDPLSKAPFSRLLARRVSRAPRAQALMDDLQRGGFDFQTLKDEIASALQRRRRDDAQRQIDEVLKRAEAAKDQESIAKGEVMDCGCCCETVTIPKMTYCNGDEPHFFCLDCARRNANNDIGNSQYRLKCMDFSECDATFSREQRLRFLDEKTMEKLERLQQQEELRLAELENLSTCPFCDFAAICPPAEEDQYKKENGMSERRVIEEARTEALIRTCHKCKVRILKEDGCNKVVCTSCSAVLCDYCGKDITKLLYNHFHSESGRGPPELIPNSGGKCPLYDEFDRKDLQIDAAEKEAMGKVRAEHPELSEEDLKIKFAQGVHESFSRHRPHHAHRPRVHMVIPPNDYLDNFDALPPFRPGYPHYPAIPPRPDGAAARPEALAGANEAQRRQQQAAHLAYMQGQAQQRLQQAQQEHLELAERLRLEQLARRVPFGQDFHGQPQLPVRIDGNRDNIENRADSPINRAFRNEQRMGPEWHPGLNGRFDNIDLLANDLIGNNGRLFDQLFPDGAFRDEQRPNRPMPEARINLEGAARHGQPLQQAQRPRPPRVPIRRNALGGF